jgi:hypothetical protein
VISILRYDPRMMNAWNDFNRSARNGHFLFDRGFMEYHADRFADDSVILREGDEILALFPANCAEGAIYSHQGLTFGGLVLGDKVTNVRVLGMFDALVRYCRQRGATKLIYKAIPAIYHRRPASEDLYCLFRFNARLVSRDVTTTIDYVSPGAYSARRRRGVRKAQQNHLVFGESDRWASYWEVLSITLSERHGVVAVHSLGEISSLASRFPQSIRLFTAMEGQSVVAGAVVFETATVAHVQYIASSSRGREVAALDGLFDHLINLYQRTKRFFDFGVSTESGGSILNEGLITHKEEFGGSSVVHDRYELLL